MAQATIRAGCRSAPHRDELRTGWPVVLAGFCSAVFAWGFGFYGQAVYLAELQAIHHWPAATISSATTCYYLGGAVLMPFVHQVISRIGARAMLAGGAVLMACGASAFSLVQAPWQMFLAGGLMSVGWAGTSGAAIATTLALWFERRRGLAISLALNGASASGFTIAPLLVQLSHVWGLPSAVTTVAAAGLMVVLPVVIFGLGRPMLINRPDRGGPTGQDERPAFATQTAALRDRRFWSVSLPFALGIAAQVGLIVHLVAFLLPRLGPVGTGLAVSASSFAAMAGRLGLGTVIDRLPQRPTASISLLSQAVGLLLLALAPSEAAVQAWIEPWMLFAGCILFGLSVGNVITLPAIIVQREFATRSFGLVVGLSSAVGQFALAFAPGIFGVLHDATGSYTIVLIVCMALQAAGAALLLGFRG
jgi:MFS family permease